ncbi:MAG: hypothetical protein H7A46_25925 [Verrucomicrobiales bacterium]|nr:hypothetical protein [Planctomycetota bacterium]MCP5524978.1 hypothetical protein [Verrucomicrobiales bacterium]
MFATTHWTMVLNAGSDSSEQASGALEELCRTYWCPIYGLSRMLGDSIEDAKDLTQGFFVEFIHKGLLAEADPAKGRFRSYLHRCFQLYRSNEKQRQWAAKRGGGAQIIPIDEELGEQRLNAATVSTGSPEVVFDRCWALTVMDQAYREVEADYGARDKGNLFDAIKAFLGGMGETAYGPAAASLGMSIEATRAAVSRLRKQYRDAIRRQIADTVLDPAKVDDEMAYLFEMLAA